MEFRRAQHPQRKVAADEHRFFGDRDLDAGDASLHLERRCRERVAEGPGDRQEKARSRVATWSDDSRQPEAPQFSSTRWTWFDLARAWDSK